MGHVWAGFHGPLRREVAVKLLDEGMAQDPLALQRFALEAQTLARLSCPHVPQVFDFGSMPNGVPFIVMELLDGVDLESRVESDGPLTLPEAESLVAQMASVLSLAHGFGVVHRDLKPANIIVHNASPGELCVKLLDFGIVKAQVLAESPDTLTRTGTTLGTPAYMSPEQLLSARDVDARADLWSLAVVVYRCLTGALPFEGETFGAMCLAIDRGEFVDASWFRPDLPLALDAWFHKALRRDPDGRFGSVGEMAAAFVAAARQAPPAHEETEALLIDLSRGIDLPPEVDLPAGVVSLPEGDSLPLVKLVKRRRVGGARAFGAVASVLAVGAAAMAARGSLGHEWAFDWPSAHQHGMAFVTSWLQKASLAIR
jgi:serine/threonine protein kinase